MTEEILIKLSTIAALKKGQTFSTSYESPVTHKSWSTSFLRTYYSEDRKQTIKYIKDVLETALLTASQIKFDTEGYNILVDQIQLATIGIENLRTTYKGDYYIIGLINQLVEETKQYLIDIKNNEYVKCEKKEKLETDPEFFEAIHQGNYNVIEDYLYDGKEPNIKNNSLQNGLHVVAHKEYYNIKILNILLNFNIDVYAKDIEGNTPLYYAISTGNVDGIIKIEEYISKKKKDL